MRVREARVRTRPQRQRSTRMAQAALGWLPSRAHAPCKPRPLKSLFCLAPSQVWISTRWGGCVCITSSHTQPACVHTLPVTATARKSMICISAGALPHTAPTSAARPAQVGGWPGALEHVRQWHREERCAGAGHMPCSGHPRGRYGQCVMRQAHAHGVQQVRRVLWEPHSDGKCRQPA